MEHLELVEEEVHSLCRTCLRELLENGKYNIFLMPFLAKCLSVCTSLMIEENDGYSKYLCKICYQKIQDFYEFREMCIKSVEKFDQIRNSQNEFDIENNDGSIENTITAKIEYTIEKQCTNDENYTEGKEDEKEDINNYEIYVVNEVKNHTSDSEYENENIEEREDKKNIDVRITPRKSLNRAVKETKKKYKRKSRRSGGSDGGNKSNNEVYTCDSCNKRFFKEEKFEAHKRTHLGLKPWQCSQCEKGYEKRSTLKNHIKYIHSGEPIKIDLFICDVGGCGKSYKFKQSLRAHYKEMHTENKVQKERNICEQCGKSFSTLAALKRHHFIHAETDELPFKCELCSKRYTTKYKLNEHIKRHTGDKNYVCAICGLKKISQHELNVHMNFHTKQKQAKCTYCTYASGNIGNVKRHERIVHHGIRSHVCKFCGNSFGKAETLKHHVMTHTGEKPHQCKLCDRRFIQMTALKTHLKRHSKKTTKFDRKQEQQQSQEELQVQELVNITKNNDAGNNAVVITSANSIS